MSDSDSTATGDTPSDVRDRLATAAAQFRAGRPDQAERLCRRILETSPGQADALHMLAVVARRAGRRAEAVGLVERALAARPDFAPAHYTRGALCVDQGRLDVAAEAFARAAALKPDSADAHIALGGALRRLGKPAEAESALRAGLAIRPRDPGAHLRLGNALADQDRLAEAEAAYREALALRPDYAEAFINLGNLLLDMLRLDEAETAYREAIALRPKMPQAHNNLGNALRDQGRLDEAVAAYGKAVELAPALAETHYNLGNTFAEQGAHDAAAAAYRRALDCDAGYVRPRQGLAALALARGAPRNAVEACDACLARDPGNRQALAIKAAALDVLGERDAVRALIDFDRLIAPVRCAAPAGFADLDAFNAALAAHALDHPTLAYEPLSKATRSGRQTRELLVEPKGPVAHLEMIIEDAVADYLAAHPADPGHPFLAHPPARWRLNVWATVLGAQGHQAAHIHPAGWLSGVYYVRLPAAVAADDDDAGWIEFGGHDPASKLTVEPERRLYRPEEGLMLLFPSYFFHRTVPFESDEARISIAFDVLPLG
ncbi:MAG: tetratricopeptide repeat protein [Alphaproteobacteria bacterium]